MRCTVHFTQMDTSKTYQKSFFFRWKHVSNQCFRKQENCENLELWSSDGAQFNGFIQSWGCDVVRDIQGACYRPLFFENNNVTLETFRSMWIRYALPRFRKFKENLSFQQDGAPPHLSHRVKAYLDRPLPERWTTHHWLFESKKVSNNY